MPMSDPLWSALAGWLAAVHVPPQSHAADPRFAAVIASAPAPAPADEPATLKLGAINERLAPIALTEAGIRSLGIEPAGHDKRAVLYRESQFAAICEAIAGRAMAAKRAALLPA